MTNETREPPIDFLPPELPVGKVLDLAPIVDGWDGAWFSQLWTKVNDATVRIGIIQGEDHWHTHEDREEFFYVVDGSLFLDLRSRTVALNAGQGYTVPAYEEHRMRSDGRCVILTVEKADPASEGA